MKMIIVLLSFFLTLNAQAGDNLRLELYEFLHSSGVSDYIFRDKDMKRVSISCGRNPFWGVFLKALPIDRPEPGEGSQKRNWVAYSNECDSLMRTLVRETIDRPGEILIRFEKDADSNLQSSEVIELNEDEQKSYIEKKKIEQLRQMSNRQ